MKQLHLIIIDSKLLQQNIDDYIIMTIEFVKKDS